MQTLSGEKLSKQQLQSNNIIKKLRGKEKETDAQMKTLREKVETQRAELDKLKKILDNKCDVEKQQSGKSSDVEKQQSGESVMLRSSNLVSQ